MVKNNDQLFDKIQFFESNSSAMFDFKRFNDTTTIKQDILRRQMNSVNSSKNTKRVNRFVYMPVMDRSFNSALLSSRPNTKLSKEYKNETASSSSTSDQETVTTSTKFSSNNIVYNMNNNNNNISNKSLHLVDNDYRTYSKSYFNNRTSTPISSKCRLSSSNFDSVQKKGGFSNKDFVDLIVVFKKPDTISSNNSKSKRN
jgi:hypothetical protein